MKTDEKFGMSEHACCFNFVVRNISLVSFAYGYSHCIPLERQRSFSFTIFVFSSKLNVTLKNISMILTFDRF